jgi:hypothetical protein
MVMMVGNSLRFKYSLAKPEVEGSCAAGKRVCCRALTFVGFEAVAISPNGTVNLSQRMRARNTPLGFSSAQIATLVLEIELDPFVGPRGVGFKV